MMPRCYPNIYRCIQCLPWHCQSVAWISSISLRGTKIHPKKPAFLRPIKSFISLKYMPRLHLLPSRISKFYRGGPPPTKRGDTPSCTHPCGMSSLHLLPKILHLIKYFLRTLLCFHIQNIYIY
jgi:hypothetical protein